MAEIRQTFTADDSGLLGALKAIRASAEANAKAFDEMSDGQKKLSAETQKALDESNKALDESIEILGKKTKATEDDKKATAKWKEEVEKAAGEVEIMGVNISQVIRNLKSKAAAMKAAATSIGGGTKALKAFRIALASTGIGLLIVALGSLVTYFTRTQRGLDKLNVAFKAIGSVIDNVIDRVALVGEGFANIFSGRVRQGIDQIKNSFKGLGEEIANDVKSATELERRSQELIKLRRQLTIEETKYRSQIEQLREEARMEGITRDEAIAKLQKASELENELASKRLAVAKEEHAIIRERNELADSKNADLDAEAEALARIDEIEAQRARSNRRLQTELVSLRRQSAAQAEAEIAQVQQLKDAYEEFVGMINDRVQAERLASLEGIERIDEERRIAIEQVKLLEAQAKAAALAAGATYDLDEAFRTLYSNIEKGYQKGIEDLTAGREHDRVIDALLPTTGLASNAERLIKNYKTALNLAMQDDSSAFQEVKEKMMDWLGLNDKDLAILSQSFKTLYSEVGALLSAHIDTQISENERLLEAIKQQSEVIQSELEHQLELQAQGRSNNVESKKRELEELQQVEARALQERQRLEQQQMRAQLAADAARQISNMVTGVTSLLAAEASKGVLGIGIAALAIPTFLALFRAAQSQAQAAVGSVSRAYKGGPLAEYLGGRRSGFVDKGGRSDIPGRGDGYRVEGTNLVIGGDEFLMNEKTSRRQEGFMNLMNSGALDGYNLYEFFKQRPPVEAFNRATEMRSSAIVRRQRVQDRISIDKSVSRHLQRLVTIAEGQKQIIPLSDYEAGYVEIDPNGNKKIIRR